MQYEIETKICQHPGARSIQQDACLVSDKSAYPQRGLLAVLADGMGGMEAGERFSEIAVNAMVEHFAQASRHADPCLTLQECFAAARAKGLALVEQEALDGGTTVVAVLIREDRCAFLSVGDSRLYLLREQGLILLNREQTLGLLLDERAALGIIPQEEAEYNIRRDILINHLCELPERPADVCSAPFRLLPGDKLALMSDGAFSSLEPAEIAEFMEMSGVSGAQAMIDEIVARQLPRQDNLSVLMLAVSEK